MMEGAQSRSTSRAGDRHVDPSDERPTVLVNHLSSPPGQVTGITRYAFGLIEALIRRSDIRLVLVTSWPKDELPSAISAGVEAVVTLPFIRPLPLDNIRQRWAIRRAALEHNVDVIYSMSPTCPPIRNIPSVVTAHDFYLEIFPNFYKRRHRLWWKVFFSDAARRADVVACNSVSTASDAVRLHSWLRGKTHVVAGAGVLPQGNGSLPAYLAGPPYVLLLGNAAPNKNIGFLVAALRMLTREGRAVRALHVGRDPTGDLAKALSGDGATLLRSLGSLEDSVLDAVLRNATALVQPSSYEGFGLPIIEAQDRGVPVIASDIPVFREVAGEGCVLVPLDDVCHLADALHRVTTDPSFRAHLSMRASENSARFTWDKSAEAAVVMIYQILESGTD